MAIGSTSSDCLSSRSSGFVSPAADMSLNVAANVANQSSSRGGTLVRMEDDCLMESTPNTSCAVSDLESSLCSRLSGYAVPSVPPCQSPTSATRSGRSSRLSASGNAADFLNVFPTDSMRFVRRK